MDPRLAQDVKAALRAFPDFPVQGVTFQDVGPVLANPDLLRRVVDTMAEPHQGHVDLVAGIESRGFILGAPLALRLGVGFIPVRKAGKLPGRVLHETYDLEYGQAMLEIQDGIFARGDRVLIVDDVIATGGTAQAAARLVERAGGQVVGHQFMLEIAALHGLAKLGPRAQALFTA